MADSAKLDYSPFGKLTIFESTLLFKFHILSSQSIQLLIRIIQIDSFFRFLFAFNHPVILVISLMQFNYKAWGRLLLGLNEGVVGWTESRLAPGHVLDDRDVFELLVLGSSFFID